MIDIQKFVGYIKNMATQQEKQLKIWVQAWQQAEKVLAELKLKELRNPNYYEKNIFLLNEILKISANRLEVSKSSGLVEMQKWFRKIHEDKGK